MKAKELSLYTQMRKAQKSHKATGISEESIYEQTGWYFDDYGNFVVDHDETPVCVNGESIDEKARADYGNQLHRFAPVCF